MQQPVPRRHIVITIAPSDTNVRHLQFHLLIPIEFGLLPLTRYCHKETARRPTLDVTLCEGGRVGKTAMIKGIIGVYVQCLHRKDIFRQIYALHAVHIMPTGEVLSVLINEIETETLTIQVEV